MLRRFAQGALVVLLLGIQGPVRGQAFDDIWAPAWEVETMTSSILFQATSLNTGPLQEIITTYRPDPFFDERFAGSGEFVQPGGAMNSGSWDVSQQTSLAPLGFSTNIAQLVSTITDSGSPGATVSSRFNVTFAVNTPTTITLDGTVTGNPAPGSDDFGRVLFKQGNGNRFHSGQQSFPFEYPLLPGETYSLEARVFGHAQSNGTSASSIDLGVSLAPTPSIKYFSFGYLDFDRVIYCSYVDSDGPGMSIIRPGELLRSYALDPKDHLVSSRIDLGSPEQVFVSGLATGRRTYEPIVFMHDFLTVDKTILVQGPELTPDPSGEAIRPSASTTIVLPETATTLDVDALISPRDPASGLPTGKTFGAVLFEDEGQVAIADWEWGPAGSQTTIDQPRVTVLGLPESPTAVAFLNTLPLDGQAGFAVAAAARDSVTLYDFGDLTLPGPLTPVVLGSIDAGGTPFDPDMLRASSNAAGQPTFSIQQGNSIRRYEYDGAALQMTAEQLIPADARGFWQPSPSGQEIQHYLFEKDGQLYEGRLGEGPSRVIGFNDFNVQLDESTPAGMPTSYTSLKGHAAVTIDASFVAPPGMDGIDVTAAKDAVLRLNGDMPSENTYTTAGQRAAVIANGTLGGDVRSAGSEIARTVVVSNPPSGDVFDAATADALIASVNPAMLARLRESLGIDGSTPASESIDALVVSDLPGGTRAAHKSSKGDTHVLESSGETDIGYQDGNDLILRAKLRVFAGQASTGNPSLIGAVAPNAYAFASNDANTPAAKQLGQAAATALDAPASSINVSAWESLSLGAGPGNETVRGEITFRGSNLAGDVNDPFFFDGVGFWFWDDNVSGSDQGTMLVEWGIVANNVAPGELPPLASIAGSPAEIANQLAGRSYILPEVEDTVYAVFLRYELTAPGESAFFTNTAGLISYACDPNFDGSIDRGDAAILAQNFGMASGATLAHGDCTGDGVVDLADLARLQRQFDTPGPPSSSAAVPEPSTATLLLCGLFAAAVPFASFARRRAKHVR